MTNEEMVLEYYNGDNDALEALYHSMHNYIKNLATKCAKAFNCYKYKSGSREISDYTFYIIEELMSAGNLALICLLDKKDYNPEQAKLTTYAEKFIKSAMCRFLEQNIGAYSLTKEEMLLIRKSQKLHSEGKTEEEIAQILNIKNSSSVAKYINYNTHFLSIHDLVPEDNDDDPNDFMFMEDLSASVDSIVYRKICVELFEELFNKLSNKDKYILGHSEGVFGREEKSFAEVAEDERMTDAGVRKAAEKAKEKLRNMYEGSKLQKWRIVHHVVMDEALHGPQ